MADFLKASRAVGSFAFGLVGLYCIASVAMIGWSLFGGGCPQILLIVWSGCLFAAFAAVLSALTLGRTGNVGAAEDESVRLWPYYMAMLGLLVLLVVSGAVCLAASIRIL